MKTEDCGMLDQIFSHVDGQGAVRHFNTTAITNAILSRVLAPDFATLLLTPSVVSHIEQNHGIEPGHLNKIPDEALNRPVLLAMFRDNTSLVIDGNHRIVKRYRIGKTTVDALVITEAQWLPFLVVDMQYHVPMKTLV